MEQSMANLRRLITISLWAISSVFKLAMAVLIARATRNRYKATI